MSAEPLRSPSEPGDLPELPKPGDVVHGRYRVDFELGRGGMGVVLQAHDQMLDRDVALKVVLPRMLRSPEAIERFSNEAKSLAQLESRHVVRVLDFGAIASPAASAGLPFMVLELLRGEDLFSVAAREGGLSPARVVRYALQACAGLAAAHTQGIIHRDLKPENLFLAMEADGTECLKVLDFGVARSHTRRALTRGQVGVGSPGYMSPEQVEGTRRIDQRADIWGLGVVMYELLAHRPAFFGDNPQSLCLQILTSEVPPLSEIKPGLPAALVYIVERCMARDPNDRFANVAELAEALAPLDARNPESDAERIRRHLETAEEPPVSATRPQVTRELPSVDVVITEPVPLKRRRGGRRLASLALAIALLVPVVALLPRVAHAPELASARAWSSRAFEKSRATYVQLRERARELWMKEPGGAPPPGP